MRASSFSLCLYNGLMIPRQGENLKGRLIEHIWGSCSTDWRWRIHYMIGAREFPCWFGFHNTSMELHYLRMDLHGKIRRLSFLFRFGDSSPLLVVPLRPLRMVFWSHHIYVCTPLLVILWQSENPYIPIKSRY